LPDLITVSKWLTRVVRGGRVITNAYRTAI
jgi:hypothetical protein